MKKTNTGVKVQGTESAQHTKGEWKNESVYIHFNKYPHNRTACCEIFNDSNKKELICHTYGEVKEEAEANAKRICKAVNMHDALMEIAETIVKILSTKSEMTISQRAVFEKAIFLLKNY